MKKEEIIERISDHIKTRGGRPSDWFVGVSFHIEFRLFGEHGVDKEKDKWIFMPANSDIEAREIAIDFIKNMGTDGLLDGGYDGANFVYAYKKSERTNP